MSQQDLKPDLSHKFRVLLAAGGTGGHLFPAEAVARKLHPAAVVLITDARGARFATSSAFEEVALLPPLTSKNPLLRLFFLGRACVWALKTMRRLNPDIVWGFGGFATLPVLLAAWILRIPRGIHQADRVLGKTNKFLSYLSDVLATTFPAWEGSVRQPSKRISQCLTGLPVRPEIEAVKGTPYPERKSEDALQLLVLGGSQGATFWGELLPEALKRLPSVQQQKLYILHQCPQTELSSLEQAYRTTQAQVTLVPFVQHMAEALKTAHIVCSRAGASTIAELSTVGRPALLVPYPWAMDDHQTVNAAYVVSREGGWMISQAELSPERLANELESWLSRPKKLENAAFNMLNCLPEEGALQLATLIYEVGVTDASGGVMR